jgi:hypothetical protein
MLFLNPEQHKLSKEVKYNQIYSIIEDLIDDKVYRKCFLYKDLGVITANRLSLT